MSLAEYRRMIDEVDGQILSLLQRRISLSKQIGEIKRRNGIPVHDQQREGEILRRVREAAAEAGVPSPELEEIYKLLLAASRRVQGEAFQVAFLGPSGTFCEQAARGFFRGQPALYRDKRSIPDIFRAVDAGEDEFGVVPAENSLEGSVNITLDLLLEYDLKIFGEIEEHIRHHLISRPSNRLRDIRVVLSHPQALSQCRLYLETNLPKAELREELSTARAVEKVARIKGAAAIGTELAATLHGMSILARGIENNPDNYTRFFVLSRRPAEPTGRDKTSIVYSIPHVPGSLQRSLETFAKRGINLTKIESRPARKGAWEYFFYCDFEGHVQEEKYADALKEFEKRCTFLKILGSYPRAR